MLKYGTITRAKSTVHSGEKYGQLVGAVACAEKNLFDFPPKALLQDVRNGLVINTSQPWAIGIGDRRPRSYSAMPHDLANVAQWWREHC